MNTQDRSEMKALGQYVLGAVLAALAMAMLSGCQTVRAAVDEYRDWRAEQKAKQEQPAKPETPPAKPETPDTPTKPETPAEPSVPQGDNSFLWKPVAETRGGVVAVITPANLTLSKVHVAGANHTREYAGRANGDRQHWYQDRTGSAFGANVKIEAFDKASGKVIRVWTVPNGAARWASH